MKLNRTQIQAEALSILENARGGIQWSEILRSIVAAYPETPRNSIRGATYALLSKGDGITKVARGTYQLTKYFETENDFEVIDSDVIGSTPRFREQDFYESFSTWLVDTE